MKIRLLLSLFILAVINSSYSQTFTLVKDIWPGSGAGVNISNELVVWNGKLYFTARNGAAVNGNELYVSDGTLAGTYMVKDINPGTGTGGASVLSILNNQLSFFGGETATTGTELYMSDGTETGTLLVKDINPGTPGSIGYTQATLNGYKYFDANTAAYGNELWRTDGTEAGTTLVKDINPGSVGSGNPREIRKVGNLLFFYADDGVNGLELWKSDGTEAGTVMVKDIIAGSSGTQDGTEFADLNGIAFFRKNDGVNGTELWRSDGTEAGTFMVKDINAGAGNSDAYNFIVFNNLLYFIASDGTAQKLWKSDGTSAGTIALANAGGVYSTYGNNPSLTMAVSNGFLFFPGSDAATGVELWKTDGTLAGTVIVKDITAGTGSTDFRNFITVNNKIVFDASTPAEGSEPWISDGTSAGTYMLQDVEPGSGSSRSGPFIISGTQLFSIRTTTANGRELWVANNFSPLPLTFISFSAQKCDKNVCLEWKTANEQNVSHFEVEKSTDGIYYQIEASIPAGKNHYKYQDDNVKWGSNGLYYRIKQVDHDNKSKRTNTIRLKGEDKGFNIYPTLITNAYTVQNNSSQTTNLKMSDAGGKIILSQKIMPGTNIIHTEWLRAGVYFCVISSSNGESYTQKLIKH